MSWHDEIKDSSMSRFLLVFRHTQFMYKNNKVRERDADEEEEE